MGIFYSEYIWGSNYVTIEYNYIHNVLNQTSDSGAIYGGRNPAGHGTVIRYNIIDSTGNPKKGFYAVGIYLDDWMAGQEIYGNIIYGVTADNVFVNGGRENKIHDNVFIMPEYLDRSIIQIGQNGYDHVEGKTEDFTLPWDVSGSEEVMIAELVPFRSELWASRFPVLARVKYGADLTPYLNDPDCIIYPAYNEVYDNTIIAPKDVIDNVPADELEVYSEYASKFSEIEASEKLTFDENPYFVNPAVGNYTVKDGADIFDCQFEKIGRY